MSSGRAYLSRAGDAIVWNSGAAPARIALGVFVSVVAARELGPVAYGEYSLILALITALGVYADFGIAKSLPQIVPQTESRYGSEGVGSLVRDAFTARILAVAAAMAIFILFTDPIRRALDLRSGGEASIRLVAVLFFVETLREIPWRILNSQFRQRLTNSVDVGSLALQLLLLIVLLRTFGGVGAAISALGLASGASAAALWLALRSWLSKVLSQPSSPDRHTIRRAGASLAGTIYLSLLTRSLGELPVVLFILAFAGAGMSAIAELTIAYKLSTMFLGIVAIPLQSVQIPLMAHVGETGRPGEFSRAYGALLRYLLFVLGPGVVLLMLVAPRLVPVLYGPQFAAAGLLVVVLSPLLAIEAACGLPMNVLIVRENYREVVWLRWLSLAVPVVVFAVALGPMPIVALAIGTTRAIVGLTGLLLAARRHSLPFPNGFAGRVLVGLASLGLVSLAVLGGIPGWTGALLAGAAGTFAFLVAFSLAGGFDSEERELLLQLPVPGLKRLLRWI